MKHLFIFIIFILMTNNLFGQHEFIVNTFKDSTQSEPSIELIDGNGNFVIVWKSENQVDPQSEGDIYLKYFSSESIQIGDEILVNDSTIGPQQNPQISSNRKGQFVIVWSSYNRNSPEKFYEIKAKLFSESLAVTNEFTVNSYSQYSQTRPQISMADNGKFIIVWESWFQDGSDRGIYAQMFNTEGEKIGDEFLINSTTQYSQGRPSVKFFNDGTYIITWESWNENELGYDLYAKIFNSDGDPLKDEFMVNSYTDNYQWLSDISVSSNGKFDIVWCSWEQDGFDGGIYLRSYDENYEPLHDEILVNSSTEFYQWLPKIERLANDKKAVIWSSWKIDGSREGVFYKILDEKNDELTLEERINENTKSYQWEPDFITLPNGELISVWSSWGDLDEDYEIVAKKLTPKYLVGLIDTNSYDHLIGNSTSSFNVHVVDSSKLTGHNYKIIFEEYSEDILAYSILDESANELKVTSNPLNLGTNVQYLTDEFDGVIVELTPNFSLDIDLNKSTFINNSGTNVVFELGKPIIFPSIAPLDISIIWGSPDTLSGGNFLVPLDTALSPSNIREIELPFYAKTINEDEKLGTVVFENSQSQNNRWDPGETVVILTPEDFRTNDFSTHVQLFSSFESDLTWPNEGDTNYIITKKPLTIDDVYEFSTHKNDIILSTNDKLISNKFILFQNYPNPFNPSTTIKYQIPQSEKITSVNSFPRNDNVNVTLKVYDILGRELTTLVERVQKPGNYSVTFDGSYYSSGIYFYKLQFGNIQSIKKMLLLK